MKWSPATGLVDLGVLPGLPSGQANAINHSGSIAGLLYDSSFSTTRHVYFWTPKDGMQEIAYELNFEGARPCARTPNWGSWRLHAESPATASRGRRAWACP